MSQRKRPAPADRPSSKSTAADAPESSVHAAWKRRREAASRLIPLDCGCRDPWTPCRCTRRPPLSEKFIDAGAQAAQHLLDVGYPPLLELEVLRALWRRGGDDRELACELFELVGGDGI
jgi:hypothetical protein